MNTDSQAPVHPRRRLWFRFRHRHIFVVRLKLRILNQWKFRHPCPNSFQIYKPYILTQRPHAALLSARASCGRAQRRRMPLALTIEQRPIAFCWVSFFDFRPLDCATNRFSRPLATERLFLTPPRPSRPGHSPSQTSPSPPTSPSPRPPPCSLRSPPQTPLTRPAQSKFLPGSSLVSGASLPSLT